MTRSLSLILLALAVEGCSRDDAPLDRRSRVYVTPEAVLTSFGSLSDTTGAEVMSHIKAAALSESGRYLAVADRSPPYLRIFDRESGAARSFGPEGRGPGELRAADAVEFLGDSVLLVLARGYRLERFNVQGEWLGGYDLRGTELLTSSMTAGCGSRIYVYGIPAEYRRLDSVPWVHELSPVTRTTATPLVWIPGTDFHFGWGGLEGFDGNGNGVLLWDRAQTPHEGYWLPCEGSSARIWSRWSAAEIDVESEARRSSAGTGGQALMLPDTLFAGAAARGPAKIWGRRAFEPDGGTNATHFRVVRDGTCRAVGLMGEWTLHDASSDGLLVATGDPFPSISVLDWGWFEERLTAVRCVS